jgi:hypothetical protein
MQHDEFYCVNLVDRSWKKMENEPNNTQCIYFIAINK